MNWVVDKYGLTPTVNFSLVAEIDIKTKKISQGKDFSSYKFKDLFPDREPTDVLILDIKG